MTLTEFCKSKIENKIFQLAVVFLIVSFLFSSALYLKNVKIALQEDVKKLEVVKTKINRTYEMKKYIDKIIGEISASELKNPELAMAQLIDKVNLKYQEAKLEITGQKQEGQEAVFAFSIKGDSSFQKFSDLVDYLQQQSYPACFINSVSLKAKENVISFEIKGEFRVIK